MKDRKKCPYCGGYLENNTFYSLERYTGTYEVRICPKCKAKVSDWIGD